MSSVFHPALFALIAASAITACDSNNQGSGPHQALDTTAPDSGDLGDLGDLDNTADLGEPESTLEADLRYLREEEKLARDVYRTLGDTWGLQVFANIASSEETHTTRVAARIAELGFTDPVVDNTVGVFVDESLAELFTALTTQGKASLEAALQVGATIEDLDLLDLAEKHTRTNDTVTLAIYEDLMCGSRNHLRAFVGQLVSRGASYEAQFLTQAQVDAIVASPRETCSAR